MNRYVFHEFWRVKSHVTDLEDQDDQLRRNEIPREDNGRPIDSGQRRKKFIVKLRSEG